MLARSCRYVNSSLKGMWFRYYDSAIGAKAAGPAARGGQIVPRRRSEIVATSAIDSRARKPIPLVAIACVHELRRPAA